LAYDEIHAPGIAEETLDKDQLIGVLDTSSLPDIESETAVVLPETVNDGRPPLESVISVHDFEGIAKNLYTKKTYAFYSSAATDLISHRLNTESYRDLLLRPRVLINVKEVSTRRSILGCSSGAPFFVSPAAMARLAHPDGELAIARACAAQDICYVISSNASYPLSDIVKAGRKHQTFFLQLYVNSERRKTAQLLHKAQELGVRAIFVTVDAPIPGKREADERIAATNFQSGMSGAIATNDKKGGGLGRVMAKYIDSTLCWDDLAWIRKASGGLPIVLKGIQTAADARKAMEYGVEGIMLSNHGGRSLDT
jgi:L-lactate dehydrogenase (cytochrome)